MYLAKSNIITSATKIHGIASYVGSEKDYYSIYAHQTEKMEKGVITS